MAFEWIKKFSGSAKPNKATSSLAEKQNAQLPPAAQARPGKRIRKRSALQKASRRDRSPYSKTPGLTKVVMGQLDAIIRKNVNIYKTDKLTLLEIADKVLENKIHAPRPTTLRAHHIFAMFTKKSTRLRSGVATACIEWQGAFRGGIPVVTTVNAQAGKRIITDARTYILQNPPSGERRNFRSKPHNTCGNASCVNTRHIELRGMERELKSGENHGRAKYTNKDIVKLVKEYNAGATAKVLAKKWGMSLTYVEQVMRKERRTEVTHSMKIRGRFKTY